MNFKQRTDLALEAGELAGEVSGVSRRREGNCHIMEIETPAASEAVGKPMGTYCTLELDSVLRREDEAFVETASQLAQVIERELPAEGAVLVACLGNRDITPDAVGAQAAKNLLVTRHLKHSMPEDFKGFRSVAVITPGVLGTSGVESASYVGAVCSLVRPAAVIAVDALAARSPDRLCRTVQVADSGITPGSGVGNSRAELSRKSLGVPVIAVGVPTVVDISTLLKDAEAAKGLGDSEKMLIVTPRDIDTEVSCAGRLVGYAINLALHRGITPSDIDMLLG